MGYLDVAEVMANQWDDAHTGVAELVRRNRATIALNVGKHLRVVVWIVIGPRKGLRLAFFAFDSRPAILADGVVNYGTPEYYADLVDLDSVRRAIRAGHDAEETCLAALNDLARWVARDPAYWDDQFRTMEVKSRSIGTVSGGLPGTDRGSRGAHRSG